MDTEVGNLNGQKAVNKGESSTKCSQRRGWGSGNVEFYRARPEFTFKSRSKRPLRDFKEQWYNLISVCKYHCYENNEFQTYKIERKMIEEKKSQGIISVLQARDNVGQTRILVKRERSGRIQDIFRVAHI